MNFLKFLQIILRVLARRILLKYKPDVVAVVGSVGKTSTKEAIYYALAESFRVRRNRENYNNEIGLPLSVITEGKQARSLGGWFKICLRGLILIYFKKEYPQFLVLEMAADKPGDLAYLLDIIPREMLKGVVLTGITPVHMAFYESFEKLFQEKTIPLSYIGKHNFLVLNRDDCDWSKVKEQISAPFLSYGLSQESDIRAEEISYYQGGLDFQMVYKNNRLPLRLKKGLAPYQIYPLLAGVGVALFLGLGLKTVIQGLARYEMLPGRMNSLIGIKETMIIDDSYNSSPVAARKAIKTLMDIPGQAKRIAVLGDMLELGDYSLSAHKEIARFLVQAGPDYLITVGKEAKEIYEESRRRGFSRERSFYFETPEKAAELLKEIMASGDIILVKGSRGIHLERLIKKIMIQPELSKSLLIGG